MRREDIANFLNAERRVSPLTAFSLLIVAGFIAGSLQLVGPVNPQTMMAVVEGTENSLSDLSSKAPETCEAAIKAALGKYVGPEVTTVAQGASGTADKCYGGVLTDLVRGVPSQNPADYKCVGRSGTVTISTNSAVTTTKPNTYVQAGKCEIKVCQPITTIVDGKTVVNPNCGKPKQYDPGQPMNPQTGGVPSIPPPFDPGGGGGGGGGGGTPEAPQPNTGPNSSSGACPGSPGCPGNPDTGSGECPGSPGCPGNPYENLGECPGSPGCPGTENDPNISGGCPGSPGCPGTSDRPGEGATLNQFGEPVVSGNGDVFTSPKPDTSMLSGTPDSGTNNSGTPRLQTSTFEPVQGGLGTTVEKDAQNRGVTGERSALEPGVRAQTFDGKWAETAGQLPSSQNDEALSRSKMAQDLGINDIAKGKWAECGDPYCMGDGSDLKLANNKVSPSVLQPGCTGSECPPLLPESKPGQQPPVQQPPAQRPPGQQPPTTIPDPQTAPRQTTGSGFGGGLNANGLMSFLGGFMKGLGVGQPKPQQGTPQTCPTDPQAYQQYQQQYNYQLQQYNYQVQNNPSYGYSSSIVPPTAPQPCRPGLGSGNGCPQLPPEPSPTTCPTGKWRQMTATGAGMVCPVWQCVPSNATTPTAQIACNPDIAEEGSRVTVSYTCTNSIRSTGYGFETNGQTSGAVTLTLDDVPAGADGINYALKCEDGQVTAGAQCTVQLAKVSISLRASPEIVPVGQSGLIGWVTTGMKSCTISSPDQSDFTARNASRTATTGIATTSAMTERSEFYLDCITVTGEERQEKITVDVYRPGTVTASIENRTDVVRGSDATLRWSFPDAPDESAVALWLYSLEEEKTVALIIGHRAKTGTYSWLIPTEEDECNMSSSKVCGTDLIPGATYAILASLYQPVNANLGEFNDSSLPEPKFIDNPISAAFKVVQ